jgi:carboxyl-terminal processing protease
MRSRAIVVAAALSAAMATGGWLVQRGLHGGDGVYNRARLFDDVMQHVARYYVDTVGEATLYQKAVDGMLYELHDPHSVYLSADRLRRLTESTTGRYGGIGIQIEPREGWIVVVAALPGTPAEQAGVETGDRIVEIEGKSTQGWTADEAMKALRGPPGTDVRFTIERPGVADRVPVTVTRREIHLHAVQHAALLRERVGYVDVGVFSENTDAELQQAVDSLRRAGMRALVLDLRLNPGGLLDQGVSVSDLFLEPGQKIVSMRGRTRDANRDFLDKSPQRWPDLPVIVLVDSGSASASEIVAGALQDHDRAAIVGTTSFGKGSAQSLFPMSAGAGALKLTTALWYTPSGRSINKPVDAAPDDDDDDGSPGEKGAAERETFRTDAGRVVYGGGGITPDVAVTDSSPPEYELSFERVLGKHFAEFRDALGDYALSMKNARGVTSRDFTVTPAMREELRRRLAARHVTIDSAVYAAAAPLINRLLGYQIARYAFGPEAEFQRRLRDDRTIAAALDLAAGAPTQAELLRRAASRQDATLRQGAKKPS